jgi:hypothetical protein
MLQGASTPCQGYKVLSCMARRRAPNEDAWDGVAWEHKKEPKGLAQTGAPEAEA